MPPHSPSQKKGNEAQNKPPQTSSRQKRQIPQADTQNAPQPTKQSQRKNNSSFPGPTMRMESVPEGTPSLPFFKNDGVTNWKSILFLFSQNVHFLNKVNKYFNYLIFNILIFWCSKTQNFGFPTFVPLFIRWKTFNRIISPQWCSTIFATAYI